jgi:hypothetical protein
MKRKLDSFEDQMTRWGSVQSQLLQDKLAERDAAWQAKMSQAVEDGDTETALKLAGNRPVAQPTDTGPDPQVVEWVGKHPWYNTDPLAQARAREISDRLKHLPVPEQLKQVERAIRKEFPEHFPKAKDPPGVQTGATRNANPSNRAKGFNDMPTASQQMARDMVKRHPDLTLEAIAKSYWTDKERSQ